jgi:benzoyl-CoA reductase/2-hydroxyglutaryl-CoA dehydratase subunit BcrC/BadD/HgdB
MWNLGQQEIIANIEKKYGIPGIVIDGDMIDSTMVSEDQIRTRIEALLETIDARRR